MTVKEFAAYLQTLPEFMQNLQVLVSGGDKRVNGLPYVLEARSVRPVLGHLCCPDLTERIEAGVFVSQIAPAKEENALNVLERLWLIKEKILEGDRVAKEMVKKPFEGRLNFAWSPREEQIKPGVLVNHLQTFYYESEPVNLDTGERAKVFEFVRMLYKEWELHRGASIHIVNQECATDHAPYDKSHMPEDVAVTMNLEEVDCLAKIHPYLDNEIVRVVKSQITDYAPLVSYYLFIYYHHKKIFPIPPGHSFDMNGKLVEVKAEL